MKRPFKYFIICDLTKKLVWEGNTPPVTGDLQTWVKTNDQNVSELKITKTSYIDNRYDAKLRLWIYWRRINGICTPIIKNVFEGTEIGKSIPILNN